MRKTIIIMALLVAAACSSVYGREVLYVATDGSDTNPGTLERPLLTIPAAVDKASNGAAILVRAGEYRLQEPLVITPANSGLTITGYPGERPVIKGSVALHPEGWKPYKGGIVMSRCSWEGLEPDMLVANGKVRPMARYPDYDSTAVRFNGTSALATDPARVRRWSHPAGGYLHAMHSHDWGDFHYRITGADAEGNLQLEGGHQNNRQLGLHPDNRMVENIFEELDAPGEWFFDKSTSTLYYYPLEGERLEDVTFEVPVLKHLVELRGSETDPVRDVTISGLDFAHTLRTFMEEYEPLLRSDWTIYRGGAIMLEGVDRCTLSDLELHHLGGNAVFFSDYCRDSGIEGSHIHDVGASGVCFVGDAGTVRSPSFEYGEFVPLDQIDRQPGPIGVRFPEHCRVTDCLIHSIGRVEKQVTGVEISMSRDIVVSHCSIYDVPRSGINISEGSWGGHVVEYNDVFDTVKETGDHGSFNSWGRDRFWHPDYATMCGIVDAEPTLALADAGSTVTLRNNRFRCDRGWDIDLDDGSSNYHIYNNLCLNGGLKLREGLYRVVENNVLVNSTFHPHVWFDESGDVFERNIVMTPYQPVNIRKWGSSVDHNIFTSPDALADARSHGTDSASVAVADLRFVDASAGDFRVAAECAEVFRKGFHNFPMDAFGVTSPRLRRIARQPVLPVPALSGGEGADEALAQWLGWNVKRLSTRGEQSATGRGSLGGVYVVSAAEAGTPLADYIRPNDVILRVGSRAVDTVDDLREAAAAQPAEGDAEMELFRNQRSIVISVPVGLLR